MFENYVNHFSCLSKYENENLRVSSPFDASEGPSPGRGGGGGGGRGGELSAGASGVRPGVCLDPFSVSVVPSLASPCLLDS